MHTGNRTTRLQERLEAVPRLPMAQYPTPLELLPRLSAETGRQMWVKRDDELGPGLGGNKVRKLEYLMADARLRKAKRVVTFGGLQSNHARLTAAAACRLGMEAHLFYFERRPANLEGNLQLNALLGSRMHFIPLGGGGGMTLENTIRMVHWVALAVVGPHYFIPVGGHNVLGCLGYVRAALEIDQQAREKGLEDAWLVTAAGSGGTLAGLMAGLALCGSPLRVLGIDVGKLWKNFPHSIARLAEDICSFLGEPRTFRPEDVPLIEDLYVGEVYGRPSPASMDAICRVGRSEGLLLDPVYTGKAFAGLLDQVDQGKLGQAEPVIFLHTGGTPALFCFPEVAQAGVHPEGLP